MLDLQEISDRLEIQDLLTKYCTYVDEKRFDELRNVFSEDAHIDYSAMGGAVGNREETIAFLKEAMQIFPSTQHLVSNIDLTIDRDTAKCKCIGYNPMVWSTPLEDDKDLTLMGYWYVDELVRTADGWRIKSRVEEASYAMKATNFSMT